MPVAVPGWMFHAIVLVEFGFFACAAIGVASFAWRSHRARQGGQSGEPLQISQSERTLLKVGANGFVVVAAVATLIALL